MASVDMCEHEWPGSGCKECFPPRAEREAVASWCIWTKAGRRPRKFHLTQEQAETEAARLAEATPGKKFIVMQVVSKFGVAA